MHPYLIQYTFNSTRWLFYLQLTKYLNGNRWVLILVLYHLYLLLNLINIFCKVDLTEGALAELILELVGLADRLLDNVAADNSEPHMVVGFRFGYESHWSLKFWQFKSEHFALIIFFCCCDFNGFKTCKFDIEPLIITKLLHWMGTIDVRTVTKEYSFTSNLKSIIRSWLIINLIHFYNAIICNIASLIIHFREETVLWNHIFLVELSKVYNCFII